MTEHPTIPFFMGKDHITACEIIFHDNFPLSKKPMPQDIENAANDPK